MLDLPILPASALPTPAGGSTGGTAPTDGEGASFTDALETAAAATSEASEPTEPVLPADESTLAALAALAGAVTIQVPVVPAAPPTQAIGDTQSSDPTPDVTVLVPVTRPGPRLELADPNPLAPTPEAGALFATEAQGQPDARPVKGAVANRGSSFGETWVNAVQATSTETAGAVAAPTTAPEILAPVGLQTAPAPTAIERAAQAKENPEAPVTAAEPASAPPLMGAPAPQSAEAPTPTVEPARLAEVQPKEVLAQIQHLVEQLEGQKLETVRITLQPEELGRIELRVTHGADQGLQVSVRAEQPHTVALLENHLTELRSNLAASGLDVANVAISAGLGDARQSFNRGFQGAKTLGINLRGIQGGETDPYAAERPIVLRLNGARGWSNAGVDLSI